MNITLDIEKNSEPFSLFDEWFAQAAASEVNDPDAAALATVDAGGMPDVRMVLVKTRDAHGFAFFTNLGSKKGRDLIAHPKAALCFHWKSLGRQIRVQGTIETVSSEEADAYFNSRHPVSRRGAIASRQSQPLDSRATLDSALAAVAAAHPDDNAIPRPEHWSGFRLVPLKIEFWQQGDNRLHDRFTFTRQTVDAAWDVTRLYP